MTRDDALSGLRQLHAEVDRSAAVLGSLHAGRLACRQGCSGCCQDGLTVFEVEAARIREGAEELLRREAPHPPGACAFLDEQGGCRVYALRPYVCRTQGLPLRWLEERGEDVVELRDICALNEPPGAPPLEELAADACWSLGPYEERLAALQRTFGGDLARVPLRSLFPPAP